MIWLKEAMWTNVFAFFVTVAVFLYAYFKVSFRYWKNKNVPYMVPSIPFGNDENPLNKTKTLHQKLQEAYVKFKDLGQKHFGFYIMTMPIYVPIDVDIIKNIMSKDFQYFNDRGFYYNEKDDPITAHLFAVGGDKWKKLRTKLTPTFTSGKMKMMFQTLLDCGKPLLDFINKNEILQAPVDIKQVVSYFTTDVIGSCAFGLDCNSFKDPNSQFATAGLKVFRPSNFQDLNNVFCLTLPRIAQTLGLSFIPKHLSQFYMNIVKDTVEYRKNHNVTRKDFMQLLLNLKENGGFSLNEIAAQAFVFFLAGFETSASSITFCLMELARHQDIQDKVRQEVEKVMEAHGGELTYEAVMDMKYTQQVIEESLRRYPPLGWISRKCVKDYQVPGTDVVINEGTSVFIPVYALHYDEEYWQDPHTFDPERFSETNKKNRNPYVYIPFGEGPRICIGLRFGMIEVKVGLALLLKNHRYTLNEKTVYPLKFDPYSFTLAAKDPIYLNVHKL